MQTVNKDKALVVFSGGQDSTTCLFWAKKHFKEVWALTFVYGQKHVIEVEYAELSVCAAIRPSSIPCCAAI